MKQSNLKPIGLIEKENRAYPLSLDYQSKFETLEELIKLVDVEHSLRYQRTPHDTFCNIFTTDIVNAYAHKKNLPIFIPRTWWIDDKTEQRALADDPTLTAVYASTVHEMNANALRDWTEKWAPKFGWTVDTKPPEEGTFEIAYVVAKASTGHISTVSPNLVMSQAGAINFTAKPHSDAYWNWWAWKSFNGSALWAYYSPKHSSSGMSTKEQAKALSGG